MLHDSKTLKLLSCDHCNNNLFHLLVMLIEEIASVCAIDIK